MLIALLSTGGDVTELRRLLRRVHDIPSILLRFKKVASTGVADWHKLFASLEAKDGGAKKKKPKPEKKPSGAPKAAGGVAKKKK